MYINRQKSTNSKLARIAVAAALVMLGTATAAVAAGNERDDWRGNSRLSLNDRLDILDLYARYSQALDNGDAEDFVTNVFAPDATFHDPSICAVGTEQLRQLALAFGKPLQERSHQHMPYNIVIEGRGDRATGHSYVSVLTQSVAGGIPDANPKIFVMGTYTDKFVKLNGKWLIQHREVWRLGPVTYFPACPPQPSTR